MRTGAGLTLICVGAILAFAVTATPSFFNLHTAGWVLMIIGVVGLALPTRTYGWLGRRVVRRTRTYPGGRRRVEEEAVPPYVAYNPGTSRVRAGLPPGGPTLLNGDPIEDPDDPGPRPPADGATEVVEDLFEGPNSFP